MEIKKLAATAFVTVAMVSLIMAFTSTKANNANKGNSYILVEIYEVPKYPDRGIHIHYGNNKREFIPFPGMEVEHHDEAGDLVLKTINKLVDDGYRIESTSAGLDQSGMITKVFMRKE
jgi:hypothetical protein